MADFDNELAAGSAGSPPYLNRANLGGAALQNLATGRKELSAAAVNDRIKLGVFSVDAILHPNSTIYYDALGTGVTVSVGDTTTDTGLAAAASAASAGSRSAIASIDISKYGRPLWDMLGYASRAAALAANTNGIALYAKIKAASTTASGTFAWQIYGHAN